MTRYVIACLIVILSYVEVSAYEQPGDEDSPKKAVLTFLHAHEANQLQDGNNKIQFPTGSGAVGLAKHKGIERNEDEPPPLPPIEEPTPPITMKGEYFKAFPWSALAKPRKDGSDPDTTTYTLEKGDTLDRVAEKEMGDPSLAPGLALYNDISASSKVPVGDKIVIPNPIIGMSSQIMVRSEGETEFGTSQSFDTKFKTGDEYKFRFEPNVDGYCYIFREGPKGVELLYPAALKMQPTEAPAPVLRMRDTGKVRAHEPIEIPIGKKGFISDGKEAGDRVFVFLSLRPIPELEFLKEKPKLKVEDVEDVMHRVKEGEIYSEGQYHLLRINDPAEILGFALNLNG